MQPEASSYLADQLFPSHTPHRQKRVLSRGISIQCVKG